LIPGLGGAQSRLSQKCTLGCEWLLALWPNLVAYLLIGAFLGIPKPTLAWAHDTGADLAKTNVNGGAIAIGHPLGASGARIMTTLVNALEQRGGRYGLQTMCGGGGMTNATIIERLG
jgi:Thiolase, C-terminal domain